MIEDRSTEPAEEVSGPPLSTTEPAVIWEEAGELVGEDGERVMEGRRDIAVTSVFAVS